jgi:hypothetical protein
VEGSLADRWYDFINAAAAKGYSVEHRDYGWIIVTPKAFRRPSEEQGAYKSERAAWRGAAFLAHLSE